jgi:hypothetical protein
MPHLTLIVALALAAVLAVMMLGLSMGVLEKYPSSLTPGERLIWAAVFVAIVGFTAVHMIPFAAVIGAMIYLNRSTIRFRAKTV